MRMAEKVTMIDLNNSNENSNKTQDSKGNNKKVFNKFNQFNVRNEKYNNRPPSTNFNRNFDKNRNYQRNGRKQRF